MTSLPILSYRNEIISSLQSTKRLVVRAPTGSGKSTQIPQMLLDGGQYSGRILILQPRRLAARMLAARVAHERGGVLGEEIGFQTRFEKLCTPQTRALFITEGILSRMMLTNNTLEGISAVVFDEFHERSLATDVGLALVKDLQETKRPDLAIIVMSATIDVAPLAAYLRNAAVIQSEGRTFPVDIRYSSDVAKIPVWDAAATSLKNLIREGACGDVLVFMPGAYEIRRCVETIQNTVRTDSLQVFPLYGDLPANRQNQVMEPCERRKIIVATNIAETSLTIQGVRHVIDSGLARVNRYDPARGFNTLYTEPISADSADQRAGRAGREDAGICVRLWSMSQHAARSLHSTPEITRVDLSETVLSLSMLGYNAVVFPWFQKPSDAALDAAKSLLYMLGAFSQEGFLTDIGRDMSVFPMHPRLARLVLEAGRLGAVRLATFAAALLSERNAVTGVTDYPEAAHTHEIASDFYAQYCLIDKLNKADFDPALCARYNVNVSAAKNILRTQALFLAHCKRFGMHTADASDAPVSLAKCLLRAYPDHLAARRDKGTLICRIADGRHAELDKCSIARSAELLVAAEIRETKDKNHSLKTVLTLATEIKAEWLAEYFGDTLATKAAVVWNSQIMAAESFSQTFCCNVLINEKPSGGVVTDEESALLADTIATKELHLDGWNTEADEWIARIGWVAAQFPNEKLPAMTDDDKRLVIHALCEGERRYDRVRSKPVLPLLAELLNPAQLRFVNEMVPQTIAMQSHRKMKISYDLQSGPRGRARIQDLYGMKSTPRIAGGRIPILIEVLAPNNRPVQITDDLARFWQVHYPEIKKTLSRKYPKHEWR